MSNRRLELQELFEKTLGSRNVYFQPPSTVKMSYPAIIYSLSSKDDSHADNVKYNTFDRYSFTYVSKTPDLDVVDRLNEIPRTRFDRSYASDGLNHYVWSVYY